MTSINLLPWRETGRAERKQEFLILIGVFAVLSLIIMAPVYLVIAEIVSNQQARNTYLTEQIELLDNKIQQIKELQHEKLLLLKRMEIIQQLQEARSVVVHIYDELVKIIPEGVYLTSIDRKSTNFILVGASDSNGGISKLMRNIDDSEWFTLPMLKEIFTQQTDGIRTSNFQLELQEKAAASAIKANGEEI